MTQEKAPLRNPRDWPAMIRMGYERSRGQDVVAANGGPLPRQAIEGGTFMLLLKSPSEFSAGEVRAIGEGYRTARTARRRLSTRQ